MSAAANGRPTTLYRFFNSHRELLYVGITSRGPARIAEHANDKPWWGEVEIMTFQHFTTQAAARAAETEAIRTESPIHNNRFAGKVRLAPTSVGHPLAAGLVAAGNAIRSHTEKRDALIVEARESGASYREIARLAGLSHVGVQKIVERKRADEGPAGLIVQTS
jgi:predicted GIY-YIG superfamily endonuclease